ncbi:hypothetical protein PCASD_05770 [Puccinia coronata f. sp. avenae]|uniref:C2H2-type domain-containing protein n=1 Tax=Puccinia coronata f. sp. avenae TaxID=200324 RepID=A0A2N5UJH8_9BASI|nr:hypothetical protein PCASD_05770 [Puccinia coronata f. sp. avenae]
MESFPCQQCSAFFNSHQSRNAHVREFHQLSVNSKDAEGRPVEILRVDTEFRCPLANCFYKSKKASLMRAHYNRCRLADIRTFRTPIEEAMARRRKERLPQPGDEVEEIPSLKEYGIYLQKRARVLICINNRCFSGVSSNEVISHLKHHHTIICPSIVLEELGFVEDPPQNIYNQQDPIPPFQGIVMSEGIVCQICFYSCVKEQSMRKHMEDTHRDSAHGPNWKDCTRDFWVQTLLRHSHKRYFHTLPKPQPYQPASNHNMDATLCLTQLLEELPPLPTFASELQNSADPRDVPPWLISTGIHGFMQETSEKGLLHSDLATIISDTSTQYLALYPVVENWLKLKTDNVLKRSGQVRMKILSTDINTAGNSPLNTLGSFKTVQHYANICTMYLVFCMDVSSNAHPGLPPCPLTPMAKALLDSFSHSISNKQSIDPLAIDCSPPPSDLPVTIPSPYSSVILQDLLHNDLANMWTYTTESDKINTPFSAMRSWQHLMASVTMYEGLPETTFWADTDYKQLSIDGHTITLPQIEKTIQRMFERVATLMEDLTKGAPLPRFDRSKYTDPPDCTDVGFNYLVASDSYHSQFGPDFLLTTWLKRGDPASYTLGGGRGWNHGKIRDWLDLSDELTKALYFCFHCGCGQPARGTEEESIKIVNTPESPRSIFWRANTFMVRTTYHKTQAITGYGKNRAVFLPGWLSQHLHNYLAYIRPAQLRFMNILADGQPDGDHTRLLLSHLWVTTSTGLMKSKHQTLILKNTFLNQGCAPLGLRQWRHACVAICDEYLKGHA